jgi:hypothetical protein
LNNLKKDDITHIDVYYVPFDILSPLGITEDDIKLDIHKKVINGNDIEQICNELLLLEKVKGVEFMDTGIYLRADFYNKDKEILRLLFDKNSFKIGNSIYNENTDLINSLIKDFKTN